MNNLSSIIFVCTIVMAWLCHKIGMLIVGIVDDVGWKETHFRKLILFLVRLATGIIILLGTLGVVTESGFFR